MKYRINHIEHEGREYWTVEFKRLGRWVLLKEESNVQGHNRPVRYNTEWPDLIEAQRAAERHAAKRRKSPDKKPKVIAQTEIEL
jgi:hypothetical protein